MYWLSEHEYKSSDQCACDCGCGHIMCLYVAYNRSILLDGAIKTRSTASTNNPTPISLQSLVCYALYAVPFQIMCSDCVLLQMMHTLTHSMGERDAFEFFFLTALCIKTSTDLKIYLLHSMFDRRVKRWMPNNPDERELKSKNHSQFWKRKYIWSEKEICFQ